MAFLSETQRASLLTNVLNAVDQKLACTPAEAPDVRELRRVHEAAIVRAADAASFERAMNAMLRAIGKSHTGFHHESQPRASARVAIAATFTTADTRDGQRWVFQDVHPGGVAARAGIRPGDVLLTLDDHEIVPPAFAPLALSTRYVVRVRSADGTTHGAMLDIPGSTEKKRPLVVPDAVVTASRLEADLGRIRVSMFPGVLGMDVARDISRAVRELDCARLVIDLRGNTGGGIGGLRLMSHLCADRRGVGYSVGRAQLRASYDKTRLPQFRGIPRSTWGVLPLIPKFVFAKQSIAVFSEGLGAQKHHGRVAILINEHSSGAAEMVAAFAQEYGLATLVGTKTAGRLVGASSFKVGGGYRVALPVAAYFTWQDTNLEGVGLVPDEEETLPPAALWESRDPQLARAAAATAATATR
ncbi:MAG: S41 family peptidase [Acidobacteriota bacterium]